jgi:hypothetical protein
MPDDFPRQADHLHTLKWMLLKWSLLRFAVALLCAIAWQQCI